MAATIATLAQNDIITQFENIKGVSTVSISKTMLKMAGGNMGDKNIAALTGKLDHIDIITTQDKAAAASIQKVVDRIAEITDSEQLFHANDNGDKVTIKYRQNKNGTNSYFLFSQSDGEYTLIIFTGTMTIEDIIAYANKN